VSIQPHEESGKLKFYAVLNGASEALVTGSKFAENGKTYIVEAVETYSYQGKGLFRKGVLREDKES
jgi:hypothetical protein